MQRYKRATLYVSYPVIVDDGCIKGSGYKTETHNVPLEFDQWPTEEELTSQICGEKHCTPYKVKWKSLMLRVFSCLGKDGEISTKVFPPREPERLVILKS